VDLAVGPSPATPEEWQATMGQAPPEQYHLTADQLHLVGRATSAMGGDIPAAVRRLAAGHIDAAAARVRPSRTWDDIILDDDRLGQLREVAVRCRQRDTVFGQWGFSPQPSTGVVALFAGPSGTGKTLAAEVIAGDLGVDLYKIDLANLVSKYIGETEKNLSRVFDAAEASSVALFFDEADALLGRRSEVSDAHDRYANIEVAYLLQRLERYEGLVVLATNLAKNIDPAFLRRLHVVVEFPMPGPAERRRIWAHCLPSAAPTGADLDLDFLADGFELSGGTIRNAVLAAAFLAAEAGTPITMAAAVVALRRELQKLGRLVRPEDFGRHASAIPGDRAG
jgi:SpoVK/Ycf46/Vps4 family AAA+-type ATPase